MKQGFKEHVLASKRAYGHPPMGAHVITAEELEQARKASDDAFMARMNVKMADPAKPLFTVAEVTRCYTLVLGESADGNEEFIAEYCLPHMNSQRNDLCFFK